MKGVPGGQRSSMRKGGARQWRGPRETGGALVVAQRRQRAFIKANGGVRGAVRAAGVLGVGQKTFWCELQ